MPGTENNEKVSSRPTLHRWKKTNVKQLKKHNQAGQACLFPYRHSLFFEGEDGLGERGFYFPNRIITRILIDLTGNNAKKQMLNN
jgi:hypothetical protein